MSRSNRGTWRSGANDDSTGKPIFRSALSSWGISFDILLMVLKSQVPQQKWAILALVLMGRHCFLCIVASMGIQTTNLGVSESPLSRLQESPMVCYSVSSVAGAAIDSVEEDRKLLFWMSVNNCRRMKMLMKRCYVAFLLLLVISAFWITGCKRSQIT